jgi:hypothetical protein
MAVQQPGVHGGGGCQRAAAGWRQELRLWGLSGGQVKNARRAATAGDAAGCSRAVNGGFHPAVRAQPRLQTQVTSSMPVQLPKALSLHQHS